MTTTSIAELFELTSPEKLLSDDPILVIDGDDDSRLLLVHHLQKLQFKNITQCCSAYDALCLIRENRSSFSMTICTMDTPIMSGSDFMEELRSNDSYERGPFIIAIENPSKEKIMLATESGVDEIMVKPYNLSHIAPKIRSAFKLFHNKKNPEKVYELAKASLRKGKFEDAGKIYKIISDNTEHAARPLVGLAKVEYYNKNYKKALHLLNDSLKRNPNYIPAYSEMGDTHVANGTLSDAIVAFQQAIELSPLNPERYEAVARLFWSMKRYEQIVDFMNLALKNNLDFPALSKYMAQSLFLLREFANAIPFFKKAIAFESENMELANQLGVSHKELKQYSDANSIFNSIIKRDPSNTEALFNKSVLLHTQGKVKEAVKILERLQKIDSSHVGARALLKEFKNHIGAA